MFLFRVDRQSQRLELLRVASRQVGMFLLRLLQVFDPALQRFRVESFFSFRIIRPRRGLQVPSGLRSQNLAELRGLGMQEVLDGRFLIVHFLFSFLVGGDHVLRRERYLVIYGAAENAQQRVIILGRN